MTTNREWLAMHGATDIVKPEEIDALKAGTMRVFRLMMDHEWHDAAAIRMRDLRPIVSRVGAEIERRRVDEDGGRLFEYRITPPTKTANPDSDQGRLF